MATFPQISDNEMNYFQFKARQLLQLKQENRDWQEYCKQVAPECSECSAGRAESQSSKSIGIQVSPRKPTSGIKPQSLPRSNQNNALPEALNNIKIKLENIDLALSKMYDSSNEKKEKNSENVYGTEPIDAKVNLSTYSPKSFDDRRKLLIQTSLKSTLGKIHSLAPKKPKIPTTVIKKKNSGFFLPHDLQVKRAAARKAYLASLKTSQIKPKAVAGNFQQVSKKKEQSNLIKRDAPKLVSKPKKKVVLKPEKSNAAEEETLVKTVEADESDEYKDENIEHVVDGILEDLLGEIVLDLSRIRQMRAERQACSSATKRGASMDKEKLVSVDLSQTFIVKDTIPKTLATDNSHLMKLTLFLDSAEYMQQRNKDTNKECKDSHKPPLPNENLECTVKENEISSNKVTNFQKLHEFKTEPKFVCGVSHIVSVNPAKAKEISLHRERFWKYLRDISRTEKGNFNPWTFCNVITESILDDCIEDIAEELISVPSTIIKDLYNQEFVKQVECHSTKRM